MWNLRSALLKWLKTDSPKRILSHHSTIRNHRPPPTKKPCCRKGFRSPEISKVVLTVACSKRSYTQPPAVATSETCANSGTFITLIQNLKNYKHETLRYSQLEGHRKRRKRNQHNAIRRFKRYAILFQQPF